MADFRSRGRAGEKNYNEAWSRARDREEALRRSPDARAVAHVMLGIAARTGQPLNAPTSSDVQALGARILQNEQNQPTTWAGQFRAGARGALDSLPFGISDAISDRVNAAWSQRPGESWNDAVGRQIAAEDARDKEDAARYGAARTIGKVAGTGAQLLGLGAVEGMILPGVRMAQASPLIARDLLAMGGLGGTANVIGQGIDDAVRGQTSSLRDYAGKFAGGALGGTVTRFGLGSLAGGIDAAATSIAQDVANDRPISFEKAATDASDGGLSSGFLGVAGRFGAEALPWKLKGKIGDALSKVRSWARGEGIGGEQERFKLGGGGYTVTDHRTFSGGKPQAIVEAKMGRSIDDLSKRQNQARDEINDGAVAVGRTILEGLGEEFSLRRAEELGRRYIKQLGGFSEYRTDHWLPQDIGAAAGMIPSLLGFSSSPPDRR
jgi:hypothetical protein